MLTSKSPKKFMIPYVEFPCPNCEHRLRVKYEYLGGKLRCKYCGHEFVSPSADEDVPWTSSGQRETEADGQAAQRRIAVLETELS
jgi:ribosomal protein S27E